MRKAVYAGSFDPITNGHLWMIEQASRIFGELVVAIGENTDKACVFSLEERLGFIRAASSHVENASVASFTNRYLVEYASSIDATHIVRGVRNEHDYTFERTMRYVNADLDPSITTVFLMPPRELTEISSSTVKGLVGPEGWEDLVKRYVPEIVFEALKKQ